MESNILKLTKEEFKNYFNAEMPYIGKGAYATVFPYNKDYCLKLWRHANSDSSTIDDYRINIASLLENQNSMFITPKRLVMVDNQIVGYLMSYIDGMKLRNINDKVLFCSFMIAMEKAEHEIANVSKEHLYLADVHSENIIYQRENQNINFYFIDCDEWVYLKNTSSKECLRHNLGEFRHTFAHLFWGPEIISFIQDRQDLLQEYKKFKNGISKDLYSQFVWKIKERLEDYTKEKIVSVGDYKRILKR